MSKPTNNQMNFNGAVQSLANTGTGGGTMYYLNLGGIKMCWGITNQITVGANTATQWSVVLPSSFFSTIQSATAVGVNPSTNTDQFVNWATGSTSNLGGWIRNFGGASGGLAVSYLVIGT